MNYQRRKSSVVSIGNTPMGGDYPVRIQSMTNSSTMDTEGSVEQCIRIIEAGGEYVRLTAQGVREAENLENIENGLLERGYHAPLIADIHFNPKAAEAAARVVEKVRINPGNFVDPVKTFKTFEYSDEEYQTEIAKIRERFVPFLNICKEHHTAIRIGVNHGSLSDRIMSRYGDTPEGMVESCLEFLRICVDENFQDVVISIKASNTSIMVRTVRLLIQRMDDEQMSFPLHLGVTEAGDGEDGRIKSAVGIGTLLSEGIGDTIRVSLSEDPEKEIPVARLLVDYIVSREGHPSIESVATGYNPVSPERRDTFPVKNIGGRQVPVVISDRSDTDDFMISPPFLPDYVYIGAEDPENFPDTLSMLVDQASYIPKENVFPVFRYEETELWKQNQASLKFLCLEYANLDAPLIEMLKADLNTVILLETKHINGVGEQHAFIMRLMENEVRNPLVIMRSYHELDTEALQIKSGADFGPFFLDMLADGIVLSNSGDIPVATIDSYAFGILQASGRRISKTEYISCPSCGRTLFDLQATIKNVKQATSHLKGLKIGIMGCIVNGPGEMADADYGYVGAGRGKVYLYKGKECMEKNIPEEEAVDHLIALIKRFGDWR